MAAPPPGRGRTSTAPPVTSRRLTVTSVRLWWERAFWVIPLGGVVAGVLLHGADALLTAVTTSETTDRRLLDVTDAAAASVMAAIAGGMVTFTGFVFSFVLLLLQFGSSQYSPRTVSYFLRARSTQWILAIFLATIVFAVVGLLDVRAVGALTFSPQASVVTAIVLLFASLVGFIVLLHSVGRRVRVDAVLSRLGHQSRQQLPRRFATPPGATVAEEQGADGAGLAASAMGNGEHRHLVRHYGHTGQVVAVDVRRLVRIAESRSLRLEVLVRVGDSVARGTPTIAVVGVPSGLRGVLGNCVIVDVERSLRYDPLYALRLLVDIALKALSPAINDPTTAVRALDEIEEVLRTASRLRLGTRIIRAGGGSVEVKAPTWQDVVELALVEISQFGRDQPQVTRRLVALIDDLVSDFPDERDVALEAVKERLVASVSTERVDAGMRRLVLTPDRQGLGGALTDANPLAEAASSAPAGQDSVPRPSE